MLVVAAVSNMSRNQSMMQSHGARGKMCTCVSRGWGNNLLSLVLRPGMYCWVAGQVVVLEKGSYVPVEQLSLQEGRSLADMYDRGFLLSSEDVGESPSKTTAVQAGLAPDTSGCHDVLAF